MLPMDDRTAIQSFSIHDIAIEAGSQATVAIPVSQQVTGLNSALALKVLHGAMPGPAIFVSGAIHGDEIIGTAVIQRLLEQLSPERLAGTIIFAPAVNIYGFASHSRYLPDRRDLNRSFPGSEKGSLAAQLAHTFLTHVIDRCSLGIDIHSAAKHRYNLPQIRIASGSPYLSELAMAFGAPIIIESPLRPGSMRALAAGARNAHVAAGSGARPCVSTASRSMSAWRACCACSPISEWSKATTASATSRFRCARRDPAGSARRAAAYRDGVCRSGDVVREGDLLARVGGLFGEDPEDLVSPTNGVIIGHATLPIVNQGDALFHVAEVEALDHAGERADSIVEALAVSEPPLPRRSAARRRRGALDQPRNRQRFVDRPCGSRRWHCTAAGGRRERTSRARG